MIGGIAYGGHLKIIQLETYYYSGIDTRLQQPVVNKDQSKGDRKMARNIMVDPARLEAAAQNMDAQAADYEKQYNLLFQEVDNMGAAWQGADNLAFVSQIKGFMDDFQKMVALMRQYSEFLKQSAKTYRNTQEQIIAGAKRLTN